MPLIVSDVDGTLLMPGEKNIGINTAAAIDYVLSKGAAFAVASGRSFTELRRLFAGWEDKIYFIASDGAVCVYRGETVFASPISGFEGECFAAHGKYAAYLKCEKLPLIRAHMRHYNNHVMRVAGFSEIDAPVYKITDFAPERETGLCPVYKSRTMTEYVCRGVNKGAAVKKLCKIIGIDKEEVISFGDGENDLELFEESGLSFAVAGASPKVKRAAEKTAVSFFDEIRKQI